MDVTQLADLRRIAKAQFDRDAQELSAALARESELLAELDALSQSEARRAAALQGDLEVAFAQTGEALWQDWANMRRKDLLARLAHQRAITAEIKARATTSFGRSAALADLEETARRELAEEAGRKEAQSLVDLELGRRWMQSPGRGD
ncbi:MAG: hypothetical protein EP318_12420 [Rhodobacteraceae bacterium]|nr:MAG: hypothetical protein EP318_12420 [Paracoccaceae bacterium]